jgi:hypothetical protein
MERTKVLFPVPLGPDIKTPPILGSIIANIRANLASLSPIKAEKGIAWEFETVIRNQSYFA